MVWQDSVIQRWIQSRMIYLLIASVAIAALFLLFFAGAANKQLDKHEEL